MKKLLAVALISLSLGGCAAFERINSIANSTYELSVSPQAVIFASNTFDALQVTATNYLRLPSCRTATISKVCRDPTATALIVPAVKSGRKARDELQDFYKTHPGQLGPRGVYDALQASVSVIENVFAQYRVGV